MGDLSKGFTSLDEVNKLLIVSFMRLAFLMKIYQKKSLIWRIRALAARQAHYLKVGGSIPSSAFMSLAHFLIVSHAKPSCSYTF